MNNPRVRRRAATFVVRLWTEEVRGQIGRWRGQIEHIQSGETANFLHQDAGVVLEFMERHLVELAPPQRLDREHNSGDASI